MPTIVGRCDEKANFWGKKYLVCLYVCEAGMRPVWLQRVEWEGTGDEIRQVIKVDQVEFCLPLQGFCLLFWEKWEPLAGYFIKIQSAALLKWMQRGKGKNRKTSEKRIAEIQMRNADYSNQGDSNGNEEKRIGLL